MAARQLRRARRCRSASVEGLDNILRVLSPGVHARERRSAIFDQLLRLEARVKTMIIASLLLMASLPAVAETITFDQDAVGSLPSGWTAGVTGRGAPKWAVEKDPTAPSPPNVLKQSGAGTFPWCVKKQTALTDGVVEVKFKP